MRRRGIAPIGCVALVIVLACGVFVVSGLFLRAIGQDERCFGIAAVTLPNGQLLAIGDRAARRYDPATNRWSAAGTLHQTRCSYSATALRDGRVLVAGGSLDRRTETDSVEIYDPTTNRWRVAAPLPAKRTDHSAILLPDGRVFITGGRAFIRHAFAAGMIYEPDADRWTTTAPMQTTRVGATVTLLNDGSLLFAGGLPGGGGDGCCLSGRGALSSAERYDPVNDRWIWVGGMTTARQGHRATLLADGRVLVTGGRNGYETNPSLLYDTAELYDPATARWQATGPLLRPLAEHNAIAFPDERVLLIRQAHSGYSEEQRDDSPAEIYDPDTNRWLPAGSLLAPRSLFAASLLADGRVLVVGGLSGPYYPTQEGASQKVTASAEVYDPITNRWAQAASLQRARAYHLALPLAGGGVLVLFGDGYYFGDHGPFPEAERYDLASDTWTAAGKSR